MSDDIVWGHQGKTSDLILFESSEHQINHKKDGSGVWTVQLLDTQEENGCLWVN